MNAVVATHILAARGAGTSVLLRGMPQAVLRRGDSRDIAAKKLVGPPITIVHVLSLTLDH